VMAGTGKSAPPRPPPSPSSFMGMAPRVILSRQLWPASSPSSAPAQPAPAAGGPAAQACAGSGGPAWLPRNGGGRILEQGITSRKKNYNANIHVLAFFHNINRLVLAHFICITI
jgi:hypothetical protein